MPKTIIVLSKVIGTVSLGILTGAVASGTYISLPTLKDQPIESRDQQSAQLVSLYVRLKAVAKRLSITSLATLVSAYMFAPSHARHPYLVYSVLSVPALAAVNYVYGDLKWFDKLTQVSVPRPHKKEPLPEEPSTLDNSVYGRVDSSESDDSSYHDNSSEDHVVSAEAVQQLYDRLKLLGRISTSVSGVAFLIATVGIYGDFS